MTKRGKYAKLFNVTGSNAICPADQYLPSLTSSADVPGPVIKLQDIEGMSLYNYASNADNYASLTKVDVDPSKRYSMYAENDVSVPNNTSVTVVSITIDNATNSSATLSVSIPIGIYISGDISSTEFYDATLKIKSVDFGIYYSGALVSGTQSNWLTFAGITAHCTSTVNHGTFSGISYIDTLQITNLVLPTQNGYVYEMRMSAITEETTTSSASVSFGMSVNPPLVTVNNNCNITTSGSVLGPNPGAIILI